MCKLTRSDSIKRRGIVREEYISVVQLESVCGIIEVAVVVAVVILVVVFYYYYGEPYQMGPTVHTKTYIFPYFYQQNLVPLTMVPRNTVGYSLLVSLLWYSRINSGI